jgi:hypothetical protein
MRVLRSEFRAAFSTDHGGDGSLPANVHWIPSYDIHNWRITYRYVHCIARCAAGTSVQSALCGNRALIRGSKARDPELLAGCLVEACPHGSSAAQPFEEERGRRRQAGSLLHPRKGGRPADSTGVETRITCLVYPERYAEQAEVRMVVALGTQPIRHAKCSLTKPRPFWPL